MSSLTDINRRGSPDCSRFQTTLWSLVRDATLDCPEAREKLFRRYWYPLYAYLRRQGKPPEEARDVVQGFFAQLLAKERLGSPDHQKCRFRTFLLTSLKRYSITEWRREYDTARRGRDVEIVSMDGLNAEHAYQQEPGTLADPAILFDRAWARMILQEARNRLRAEWERDGSGDAFDELAPTLDGDKTESGYEDIAVRRQMSVGAVKKAVFDLRRNFRLKIQSVLAEECQHPDAEVGPEDYRDFYDALGA